MERLDDMLDLYKAELNGDWGSKVPPYPVWKELCKRKAIESGLNPDALLLSEDVYNDHCNVQGVSPTDADKHRIDDSVSKKKKVVQEEPPEYEMWVRMCRMAASKSGVNSDMIDTSLERYRKFVEHHKKHWAEYSLEYLPKIHQPSLMDFGEMKQHVGKATREMEHRRYGE